MTLDSAPAQQNAAPEPSASEPSASGSACFLGAKPTEAAAAADSSDNLILLGFLLFNAIFRRLLLGVNQGEYTDGILQITQFETPDSFWPPLYTALIWLLRQGGMEGIEAGRLISWASSVALVLPLWWVARAWGGRRVALYTALLYTASPLALRWSLRVMTDMPYTFLFHLACAGLLLLWSRSRQPGASASVGADAPCDCPFVAILDGPRRKTAWTIAWVTLVAALAALTRYQGVMLAPLVFLTLAALWTGRLPAPPRFGTVPLAAAILSQAAWLGLPAWLLYQRFGHVAQVTERASIASLGATIANYWNFFEMFLYITPYVLTLPVFVFFTIGLVRGAPDDRDAPNPARLQMPLGKLFLYAAFATLAAQSVFQSFQTRYLLPLLPLALTFAGAGMARAERALGRKTFIAALLATLLWSGGFAMTSLILQRQAFGDIFAAGRRIAAMDDLPPDARLYTSEVFKAERGIIGVKVAYAAGRPATLSPEMNHWLRLSPSERMALASFPPNAPRMAPGSILVLDSMCCGGPEMFDKVEYLLRQRYKLDPLDEFTSEITPLLPDIMARPGSHQNPLAWAFHYQSQGFITRLYRIEALSNGKKEKKK